MPNIPSPDFKVNLLLRNKHFNTIYTSIYRKVEGVQYDRVSIATPDGDELSIDRSIVGSRFAAIVVHGLESSTERAYLKGAVKSLNQTGGDVYALCLRSCDGKMNKTYQSYHSGKTDDLGLVVDYLIELKQYTKIVLVGFSLGGNIVLRYLGEQGQYVKADIVAAAAFSVPCDLRSSSIEMAKLANRLYMYRFVRSIKKKLYHRMKMFPEKGLNVAKIEAMKTFNDIDNLYTAPAHGFKDAEDYWAKCSSKPLMPQIAIPTLLINAKDDPFLGPECFPYKEADINPNLYFSVPKFGGHVGFTSKFNETGIYWHEQKMIDFFRNFLI